tara:strand:+ start:431 stop:685 length:255 start_codon:yes stop_codon:yes gene_type:complete
MTAYEQDQKIAIKINDSIATRAWYNLVVSIRDVKLWKAGMKPHRHWRITDVKNYFGVKGNTQKVLDQLLTLKETYETGKTNLTN